MNLRTYIDLYQRLEQESSTHENSRAFALEKRLEKSSAQEKLKAWIQSESTKLAKPRLSEALCKYLYHLSLILGSAALVAGVFTGAALLDYNGKEPVNIIYFLAVAVGLPLVTMLLTLLSMRKAQRTQNFLLHISPAYWMEKVLRFFPSPIQTQPTALKINPLLLNWLVIKRAQLLSLLFAVGLLTALLGTVATRDVAFGWSTTLQISATQFHALLETIAWPWREWLPSAVPSPELVEQSQYFRLGGTLNREMVAHAGLLGKWWKFLACATLFYAIVLRFALWILSLKGFGRAIRQSLLTLEGSSRLLYQMETPLVDTTASEKEKIFIQHQEGYPRIVPPRVMTHSKLHHHAILGWAMDEATLALLNDSLGTEAALCFGVGGNKTLQEDHAVLAKISDDVLLYVKAWEPPTMDIMDFIEILSNHAAHITILPVGTAVQSYQAAPKALSIWERKLLEANNSKVWLWRNS